jgi:hypothetical protein
VAFASKIEDDLAALVELASLHSIRRGSRAHPLEGTTIQQLLEQRANPQQAHETPCALEFP